MSSVGQRDILDLIEALLIELVHHVTPHKRVSEPFPDTDPGAVHVDCYDIVCNGYKVGSASIRIHRRDVQEEVFALLNYSREETMRRFGHVLTAFEYGTPPDGGIARGIERPTMLLADESNIKEVIAFPKTASATDPMTDGPSEIDQSQLEELRLRVAE